MKKRLLILCSVLVLIVALAAPAFAAEATEPTEDPLQGIWVLNETLIFPDNPENRKTMSFHFNFLSNEKEYIEFRFFYENTELSYMVTKSSSHAAYKSGSWVDPATKQIEITSKLSTVSNGSDLLTWLQSNATKQVPPPPPPPVYNSVPDAVTGELGGYLEIIGSILTALFTPTGDLFHLGVVIAVCFVGAVIYGGIRLFRKLTPGV